MGQQVKGSGTSASELTRACDWERTDLGPRAKWPAAVEQIVSVLLESPVPMCYQHGERLAMVYNDAFAVLLGDKHPAAWARPSPEVVAEVWDQPSVGPVFEELLQTGKPFLEEGTLLNLERGRGGDSSVDEGYFLRAGSPVRDEAGAVVGVLHVVIETTEGVRRVKAVAELASALAAAAGVDDVTKVALRYALSRLDAREALLCLPGERGGWRVSRRRADDVMSSGEERLPPIWTDLGGDRAETVRRVAGSGVLHVEDDLVMLPLRSDGIGNGIRPGVGGAAGLRMEAPALAGADLAVLSTYADLVAGALARARLFDDERTTAELLQRTLLPQALPESSGVTVAARYEPVSSGLAAGGDFYDAFALPDGRLVLVIGDVMGRGVYAATVMGQVRSATRGAALNDPAPEKVLTGLDTLVATLDGPWPSATDGSVRDPGLLGLAPELFVTMLYGVLDPRTGELALASAGHYSPAIVRRAEATSAALLHLDAGPPLGVGGHRPVLSTTLSDEDLLLAFTDGLLERRARSLDEGERALLAVLREIRSSSPRGVCQQVIERLATDQGFEDDCALLAVGLARAAHRSASLVVPPQPQAVRRARHWVSETVSGWQVDDTIEFAAVTGVSELVTNVVLHAGTDARVTLDLDRTRLLVTVADTGGRGAPEPAPWDRGTTRGRGLALVNELADAFGMHKGAVGSTVWFEVSPEH